MNEVKNGETKENEKNLLNISYYIPIIFLLVDIILKVDTVFLGQCSRDELGKFLIEIGIVLISVYIRWIYLAKKGILFCEKDLKRNKSSLKKYLIIMTKASFIISFCLYIKRYFAFCLLNEYGFYGVILGIIAYLMIFIIIYIFLFLFLFLFLLILYKIMMRKNKKSQELSNTIQ